MPTSRACLGLAVLAAITALAGCCRSQKTPPVPTPPRVAAYNSPVSPVRDYWTYNGYLETTEAVEVRARVRAEIVGIEFIEGTEVAENKLLYKLDQREYDTAGKKAEAELAKAKAEVTKAEADVENWKAQIELATAELERADQAIKSGAASKTDQDKAQASLKIAKAQLDAAKANLNSMRANADAADQALQTAKIQFGYTEIRAKIAGRISRTQKTRGNLVGQSEPTLLTTIVRVDELFIYFDAPEGDLNAFQRSVTAGPRPDYTSRQIPVEIGIAGEDGYPHAGQIDFRENRVDTASGTVRIRGRIQNPLKLNNVRLLYPGLSARVRVPKSEEKLQTVVPEDCLLTGQEGRFVYVVGPDGTVEKRLVTLGASVWKAPQAVPGVTPPSWTMINPNPQPPPEGQPAPPTL